MSDIQHALILDFYQPPGRLPALANADPDALRRSVLAIERLVGHAHKYADVARLHVAFAPGLFEQLNEPAVIDACRDAVDIPAMLESLRAADAVEFIGRGERRPVLGLIPEADRLEQLRRERAFLQRAFGREARGYWPPEGIFEPALIPLLKRAGYHYLILPAASLAVRDGAVDPWRAWRLCAGEDCLPVAVLDAGFSHAQATGMDVAWFADNARDGAALAPPSDAPRLLVTASAGDRGDWFLPAPGQPGFFERFFSPYMEFCEVGRYPVRPVFLSAHLRQYATAGPIDLAHPQAAAELLAGDEGLRALRARLDVLARQDMESADEAIATQARQWRLQAEDSALLLGAAAERAEAWRLIERAETLLGPACRGAAAKSQAHAPDMTPARAKTSEAKTSEAKAPPARRQARSRRARAATPAQGKPRPRRGRNTPDPDA